MTKKSSKNFFWLLLLFPFFSNGQEQHFFDEAEAYFKSKEYDQALSGFQKAYTVFEEVKDSLGMTKCLIRQGYIQISKFQKKKSLLSYQQAANIAQSIGDKSSYLIAIDAISSTHLYLGETHKAIPLLKEGLQLEIELDSVFQYSSKMVSLGRAYSQIGKLDSAQAILYEALKIKQDINHKKGEAGALNCLSRVYYFLGDFNRSLDYEQQCLNIRETQKDSLLITSSLKNLSDIFISIGDFEKAESYALKGYKMANHLGLSLRKAHCLSNLALINENTGHHEKAIEQYEEVISIYRKSGDKPFLIDNLLKVSDLTLKKGESEKAKTLIEEAYDLAYAIDHKVSKVFALYTFGNFYIQTNQADKALPLLLEGAEQAKTFSFHVRLKDISQLLAQIYSERNQYQEAFEWQERYSTLVDTIFQQEKQQTIYNLEARYQVNQKEKQITLLNTQNELGVLQLQTAKRRQLFQSIGLLALAAIIGLGFFFYRTKQRDNQLLEEKNKIISQALSDKELLLKEIHHRVKNNLQVISSLLSMQSYQIKDEQALEAVRESKDRVKSMALIHQSLYQDVNLIAVDSKTYIEKLTKSLFHSYNIDAKRISFQSQIDPLKLDIEIMIPLGLILNELISNALKYAFQDGRKGQINVHLTEGKNLIQIKVSDNGIGLPKDFNIEQAESMGYLIVKDFCKKLNAFFQVSNQNGTQINLSIPYKNN